MADTIDVANTAFSDTRKPQRSRLALRHNCSGFGSGIHCPNVPDQWLAATGLSTPPGFFASPLHRVVRCTCHVARPRPCSTSPMRATHGPTVLARRPRNICSACAFSPRLYFSNAQ